MYRHVSRAKAVVALTGLAIAMQGCTAGEVAKNERVVKDSKKDVEVLAEAAKQPAPKADTTNVAVKNKTFVGSGVFKSRTGEPLPSRVQSENGITIRAGEPMSLEAIATKVTEYTGIPVRLDLSTPGSGAGNSRAPQSSGVDQPMQLSYSGSLSGLLNKVTTRYGLAWEYRGGAIKIYKYTTRTFKIHAFPGKRSVKNEVGNSGSGDSGGGGGEGSATAISGAQFSSTYSAENGGFSTGIKKSIKAITGPRAQVKVNKNTSTVTVVARPNAMDQVKKFIDEYNKNRTRQVALNVAIYRVHLERSDEYALSLDKMIDLPYGADLSVAAQHGLSGTTPASSLGWAILDDDFKTQPDYQQPAAAKNHSATAGVEQNNIPTKNDTVQANVIKALSEKDNARVVTSTAVTAMNNETVPVQGTDKRTYVSKVETSLGGGGGSQQGIETAESTVGVSLNVTPQIQSSGDVMMRMGIDISRWLQPGTASVGSDQSEVEVTLPHVQSRSFMQQLEVPSGYTLVMAGFERNENSANLKGTGRPDNMLLGGKQEGERRREILVIVMTPEVIDIDQVDEGGPSSTS